MTTISCLDCAHIVFVANGCGRCSYCHAAYKVTVEQVEKSSLEGEELKDRMNRHRG